MEHKIIKEKSVAQKVINEAKKEYEKASEKIKSEWREKNNKIRDNISELERKKTELEEQKENKIDKLEYTKNKVYEQNIKPIIRYNIIIALIKTNEEQKRKPKILDFEIDMKENKEVINLGTVYKSDTINIKSFIIENDKPVNKFDLLLVGEVIFNENIIKYSIYYGVGFSTTTSWVVPNFCVYLKKGKNIDELKEWHNKNKNQLNDYWCFEQHKEIEKLFKWVQENCNTKEWKKGYLLSEKKYYENSVSRGIETREYKEVVKKLKGLK